ncbi:arylamine N-acetyltransferase family protein [Paraburkholderia ferrariae]|uniref:arylamine N-acetyltransferase family protein n=1 Tax=Paraburkholderia ferrariae TaxID=386056 RepID=UPI0005A8BD40|nr:arylamine N-acetyltransferase [Paraburkholderia ferrariae]
MTASLPDNPLESRFDLDRYFARIGYGGPRAATLDVLRTLHRLHPLAIPFEGLDAFAGRPVSLRLDDIVAKLVDARRGGYCFEHNTLFARALAALGFAIAPLAARVVYGRTPDAVTPRSHMLLRVEVEGAAWLADVGFGGATLCAPLAFAVREPQPTPLEPARLDLESEGIWTLAVREGDAWANVYRFESRPAEWVDYDVANWYTSTSPDSFFTGNLVVCGVRENGRAALFNDHYSERDALGRRTLAQTIASAGALKECLRERFGIDAADFDTDALFARITGRGPAA